MRKYEEPKFNKVSFNIQDVIAVSPQSTPTQVPDTLQNYLGRNDMATEEPGNIRSFRFGDTD